MKKYRDPSTVYVLRVQHLRYIHRRHFALVGVFGTPLAAVFIGILRGCHKKTQGRLLSEQMPQSVLVHVHTSSPVVSCGKQSMVPIRLA